MNAYDRAVQRALATTGHTHLTTRQLAALLDCTEEAAQQMAEQGSLGSGGAPGAVGGNTLRPPQIPIAPAPAPAAPPAG